LLHPLNKLHGYWETRCISTPRPPRTRVWPRLVVTHIRCARRRETRKASATVASLALVGRSAWILHAIAGHSFDRPVPRGTVRFAKCSIRQLAKSFRYGRIPARRTGPGRLTPRCRSSHLLKSGASPGSSTRWMWHVTIHPSAVYSNLPYPKVVSSLGCNAPPRKGRYHPLLPHANSYCRWHHSVARCRMSLQPCKCYISSTRKHTCYLQFAFWHRSSVFIPLCRMCTLHMCSPHALSPSRNGVRDI
jgi:hypothetical protein